MDQKNVLAKIAVNAWQIQVGRSSKLISELSDDQLLKEIAPGKNRGVYLVGHLAAVSDTMPEILGFGDKSYPDLQFIFLKSPDKTIDKIPAISELRQIWTIVHDRLSNEFEKMTSDLWFTRHSAMTDEDFEQDPARNKLSVLLNRTNHLAYHFGQLRLLK